MNSQRLEKKKKVHICFPAGLEHSSFLNNDRNRISPPLINGFIQNKTTMPGVGGIGSRAECLCADVRSVSPSPDEEAGAGSTARP